MADLVNEKNGVPMDKKRAAESADVVELKDMLIKLGFNVGINLKDVENICYDNSPPESRFELIQEVMFRIHPEKEFWVAKNETEINSKILQVSSWFGLASSDTIVMGGGTRSEQKRFWKLALTTAVQLENPEVFTPVDFELVKHLDFIVLNSSILDETLTDVKGIDISGGNGLDLISKLMERIEGEKRGIEAQIQEDKSDSLETVGYKSSKSGKRKLELVNSLKAVQKNMSALLDKYKVLCPPNSAVSSTATSSSDNGKLFQEMKDTFNRVVNVQNKLRTLNVLNSLN